MAGMTERDEYLAAKMGKHCVGSYHSAAGRQLLLDWAIDQGWWHDFLDEYKRKALGRLRKEFNGDIPLTLISKTHTLAEQICSYLKERDDA